MTHSLITKVAVQPALDQSGRQIATGELITFDPNLSRDPAKFIEKINKSNAFRDPGKGKLREAQADIFPAVAGGTTETATPPVLPPLDGETGGIALQDLGLAQSIVEGLQPVDGTVAPVEEEAPVRSGDFNATAVIDGNATTVAARVKELASEDQIDAVVEAEKAKGNRSTVLEALEARRTALAGEG